MDKTVLRSYSEGILSEAVSRFAIAVDSCHLIAQSENFVYECQREGHDAILRVTPGTSRGGCRG